MIAYGIPFNNRRKPDDLDRSVFDTQFVSFAALCESIGVAKYVKGVEYSSNHCSFDIDIDDEHQFNDIGGGVEWAADQSLSQFIIFGRCEHKGGLDE